MSGLLERQLLFVTGKGGVGKTTVAAALGRLAARRGRRTIVVEVGDQSRLAELFGLDPSPAGVEQRLESGLSRITIDPDRALLEWLQSLGGRISGRLLASSGTFQYFAAAAPGTKELVTLVKISRLLAGSGARGAAGGGAYELVVLDAPATGHALGMLGAPHTFQAIARGGPVASQTRELDALLADPARTGYVGVALATEMAITEALELEQGLHQRVDQGLSILIVNALMPRRFTSSELVRIAALEARGGASPSALATAAPIASAAAAAIASASAAANTVHRRARFQHNQLARLRRREFPVVGLPFVWEAQLDLAAVQVIAARLERAL